MASTMIPRAPARSALPRQLAARGSRYMSGTQRVVVSDPSRYVTGVKESDLKSNEVLAAYFEANFAEQAAPALTDDQEAYSDEEEKDSHKQESYPLNIRPLLCYKRDPVLEEGSRNSRRLRRLHDSIPGLLYGGDPTQNIYSHQPESKIFVKTPWRHLHRELDRYHRHFESRVYDLTVYEDPEDTVGTVHRVLPRNVQWHPVKETIFCANYLRYFPGRPIKIPIVYVNEEESPALKRGGFLVPVSRFVECLVEDGVSIPEYLELECTGLRLKEVVRMDRIVFPEGVQPSKRVKRETFLVGTVFGKRSDEPEEAETEE